MIQICLYLPWVWLYALALFVPWDWILSCSVNGMFHHASWVFSISLAHIHLQHHKNCDLRVGVIIIMALGAVARKKWGLKNAPCLQMHEQKNKVQFLLGLVRTRVQKSIVCCCFTSSLYWKKKQSVCFWTMQNAFPNHWINLLLPKMPLKIGISIMWLLHWPELRFFSF